MPDDARRAQTLRRVLRLREVETMSHQRDLAEARGEERRMAELVAKTRAMAREYSARAGVVSPSELAQSLGLAGSLITLGAQARTQQNEAAAKAGAAARQLSQLEHQQERISERIAELDRTLRNRAEARVTLAANADFSRLARRLQS